VVEGGGEHLVESRLQFAPGSVGLDGATARTNFDDANLLLRACATKPFADIHLEKGQENPRGGWYSDSYGKIEPAPALSLSVRTALPWRCATLLFPYRGKQPPQVDFSFDGRIAKIRSADADEVSVPSSLPSKASSQ
jgi:hypothetical protein